MNGKIGVVTFGADVNTKARIGDEWCADLAHLSPAPNHVPVRFPISSTNADNTVDIEQLRKVFQIYKSKDFKAYPVLHGGLEQQYSLEMASDTQANYSPNTALGLPFFGAEKNTNPFLNYYIKNFSDTAVHTFKTLGNDCPEASWIWNEPNLAAQLKIGLNCPPGARFKLSSISPEVFASLLYIVGSSLKRDTNMKTVWPGSLSCLVKYNTDPAGTWIGGYFEKSFDYLKTNKAVNWQDSFDGISLNMEGYVTEDYAKRVVTAIKAIQKKYGLKGPIVIGEWGLRGDSLNIEAIKKTYKILCNYFEGPLFFFQHPTYLPYDTTGYGCSTWKMDANNIFIPTGHTDWFAVLQDLFKNGGK